ELEFEAEPRVGAKMRFEWDKTKAAANLRKHGVSFDEAATVFLDDLAASGPDPDHSVGELRYLTFGVSRLVRLLAVSHSYRPGAIRIISARRATRTERMLYEEG
ncbi:MAG TPA: BrnT family toxin, partial [Thermoanaerobaculia bacterium]|nr:BrnT family toxin [Thermoanaerobaculia bacterium]